MDDKVLNVVKSAIGRRASEISVELNGSTIKVTADTTEYHLSTGGVFGIVSDNPIGSEEIEIADALTEAAKDIFIALLPF